MSDAASGGGTEPATGLGIGARLRAARERAGYTVIEAAERLHMEPRMVEALDAESFDVLGAPVYARGHLRRYAELVGEAAAELQQLYAATLAPAATPDLRQVPYRDRTPAAARSLAVPIALGFVIVAVVGVVGWVLRAARQPVAPRVARAAAEVSAAGAPAPVPAPAPPVPTSVAPSAAVSEAGAGSPPPDTAAAVQPGAGGPAPTAPMAPMAPTAVVAAVPVPRAAELPSPRVRPVAAEAGGAADADSRPRPVELQLRFSADSWTEVYDADGNRLFYNVAAANTEQTLAGKAPMRVVLGHAPGVSVSINGRTATIPEAALRSDVADFVVSAAGRLATVR